MAKTATTAPPMVVPTLATRDRIARVERGLANWPLRIMGLSAEQRAELIQRIWYHELGPNYVGTTMQVLPLAVTELRAITGAAEVFLRYSRGIYRLSAVQAKDNGSD